MLYISDISSTQLGRIIFRRHISYSPLQIYLVPTICQFTDVFDTHFSGIIYAHNASNAENVSIWWRHHVIYSRIWVLTFPLFYTTGILLLTPVLYATDISYTHSSYIYIYIYYIYILLYIYIYIYIYTPPDIFSTKSPCIMHCRYN